MLFVAMSDGTRTDDSEFRTAAMAVSVEEEVRETRSFEPLGQSRRGATVPGVTHGSWSYSGRMTTAVAS